MNAFAEAFGKQLARPSGLGGRMVGGAMRIANRRATALTIAALDIVSGHAVLDLGCGSGDAIPALLRAVDGHHAAMFGFDHSPDMIAAAKRRYPGVSLAEARFDALPLPDASIDRILATNVAYFWHDHASVLREIGRVMRPGGRLAVYVTEASALRRAGLGASGTHRLFDAPDLVKMLGPNTIVDRVNAGLGVSGWIATLDY